MRNGFLLLKKFYPRYHFLSTRKKILFSVDDFYEIVEILLDICKNNGYNVPSQ